MHLDEPYFATEVATEFGANDAFLIGLNLLDGNGRFCPHSSLSPIDMEDSRPPETALHSRYNQRLPRRRSENGQRRVPLCMFGELADTLATTIAELLGRPAKCSTKIAQ